MKFSGDLKEKHGVICFYGLPSKCRHIFGQFSKPTGRVWFFLPRGEPPLGKKFTTHAMRLSLLWKNIQIQQ